MGKKSITDRVQIDTGILAGGAILAAIGSLLVAVGMLLGGIAFASAIRSWARSLDKPPSEFAKAPHRQAAVGDRGRCQGVEQRDAGGRAAAESKSERPGVRPLVKSPAGARTPGLTSEARSNARSVRSHM